VTHRTLPLSGVRPLLERDRSFTVRSLDIFLRATPPT